MYLRLIFILWFLNQDVINAVDKSFQSHSVNDTCVTMAKDLVFVLDLSNQSTDDNINTMKEFIKYFQLKIKQKDNATKMRLATIAFTSDATIGKTHEVFSPPGLASENNRTLTSILNDCCSTLRAQHTTGGISSALNIIKTEIFQTATSEVVRVVVLFTNRDVDHVMGSLNEKHLIKGTRRTEPIQDLKSKGVHFVMIKIKDGLSEETFSPTATSTKQSTRSMTFTSAVQLETEILALSCNRLGKRRKRDIRLAKRRKRDTRLAKRRKRDTISCNEIKQVSPWPGENCIVYYWWKDGPDANQYRFTGTVNGSCMGQGMHEVIRTHTPTGSICKFYYNVTVYRCSSIPVYFPFGNRYCYGTENNLNGSYCNYYCDSGFILRGPSPDNCGVPGNPTRWTHDSGSPPSCQLSRAPSLSTCQASATDSDGHVTYSSNGGSLSVCSNQRNESQWIRTQPTQINVSIGTTFSVSMSPSRSYERDGRVGVVSVQLKVFKVSQSGSETLVSQDNLENTPDCPERVNDSFPLLYGRSMVCRKMLGFAPLYLQDSESLCADMEAFSGGYYIYPNPITYQRIPIKKRVCFKYDGTKPVHCSSTGCSQQPMQLSTRVTRSAVIQVFVSGWFDPTVQSGGSSSASQIVRYNIGVHRVLIGFNTLNVENTSINGNTRVWGGPENFTVMLPGGNPNLYAIILEVHDNAGNIGFARRFVMFDNSSTVELRESKSVRVVSTYINSMWQTGNSRNVCISWQDRFYNTWLSTNNFLLPVSMDSWREIYGQYDQTSGLLSVNGTANVEGVVKFEVVWGLDGGNMSTVEDMLPVEAQAACFHENLKDGDKCRIGIRAIDVMGNSKEDNVYVFIDHSDPEVNITDSRGIYGPEGVHIKTHEDLSHLVLTVEAMDPHSGIRQMHWTFGVPDQPDDVGSGTVEVQRLRKENCTAKDYCYCPVLGSCETYQQHFWVSYRLVNRDSDITKNISVQQRRYYTAVTATNFAGLQSTIVLDFFIDTPSSADILVLEGLTTDAPVTASGEDNQTGVIVGAVLGSVIAILLLIMLIILWRRQTRVRLAKEASGTLHTKDRPNHFNNPAMDFSTNEVHYDQLKIAQIGDQSSDYMGFAPSKNTKGRQDNENIYENFSSVK